MNRTGSSQEDIKNRRRKILVVVTDCTAIAFAYLCTSLLTYRYSRLRWIKAVIQKIAYQISINTDFSS